MTTASSKKPPTTTNVIYEYEKYLTTKEDLKSTLDQYGVAIIPHVIDDQECDNMVNNMWDYLEHISQTWSTPFNRHDPDTYCLIYKLFPVHSMLIQHFQVGHSKLCWDLRQNPKIIDIFAKLWKCSAEDLLVSFDAVSFHMPSELTGRGYFRKTWYHCDQSYTRNDFECVQSWVTALDVNDGDGTLSIYEGSHLLHKEFQDKFQTTEKKDWYKLTEEQKEFYLQRGCVERRVKCPKGSMVFWDSRTIHCGVEPLKDRAQVNTRCVVYLCYTPRSLCTEKLLAKKIKAFEEMRMTSHWPHKAILFSKSPNTYGVEVLPTTPLPPPTLTDLGRRLVGYSGSSEQQSVSLNSSSSSQPAKKKQKCS